MPDIRINDKTVPVVACSDTVVASRLIKRTESGQGDVGKNVQALRELGLQRDEVKTALAQIDPKKDFTDILNEKFTPPVVKEEDRKELQGFIKEERFHEERSELRTGLLVPKDELDSNKVAFPQQFFDGLLTITKSEYPEQVKKNTVVIKLKLTEDTPVIKVGNLYRLATQEEIKANKYEKAPKNLEIYRSQSEKGTYKIDPNIIDIDENYKAKGTEKILQSELKTYQEEEIPINKVLNALPHEFGSDSNVKRLLEETDEAHGTITTTPKTKTTIKDIREVLAAIIYAKENDIDPSTIKHKSANIDFTAQNKLKEEILFDPFLSRLIIRDEHPVAKGKLDSKWADETYVHHTDESKGSGVTGIWDQSFDSSTRVTELDNEIKKRKIGKVKAIDTKLDEVYVRENIQVEDKLKDAFSKLKKPEDVRDFDTFMNSSEKIDLDLRKILFNEINLKK